VTRASLPSRILVAVHAAHVRQLRQDGPFFLVRTTLVERSLCVAETLGPGGETWRGHVPQDVGTLHPVDMGAHGVKALGGPLLKTEILLDTCMHKFYSPAPPIPCHALACGRPQSMAGKRRAATSHNNGPPQHEPSAQRYGPT
jgi:hypothetical protein